MAAWLGIASCCSNIRGAGGAAAAPKVAYTKSLPGGGLAGDGDDVKHKYAHAYMIIILI